MPFIKNRINNSVIIFLILLLPCACASPRQEGASAFIYAMEGPPLAVTGKLGDLVLDGNMERGAMAGFGKLDMHTRFIDDALVCTAQFDSPPNEKNRVKGILRCENMPPMFVTIRNLGPDQGVGIGRSENEAEDRLLVFFYHPSREEAERRLPEVVSDIQKAMERTQSEK